MCNRNFTQYLYVFYLFVFLLDVIYLFWSNSSLYTIIGLFAIVMIAINFKEADRVFKILGIILLSAGAVFYLSSNESVTKIPSFFCGEYRIAFSYIDASMDEYRC
ncbi:hypothetical protein [Pseudalkalibacillus sp. NRS-1564]|uniref:hypothetical protein n=1 Tax=Pseudalkalibacillus sp. NRS-1564 TaxID=3233900 RepID=UPI003D2A8CC7